MDSLHRVLIGQTVSRRELKIAGVVVILWILIDVIQFSNWLWGKLTTSACQ